jgi:hypothetical protein
MRVIYTGLAGKATPEFTAMPPRATATQGGRGSARKGYKCQKKKKRRGRKIMEGTSFKSGWLLG